MHKQIEHIALFGFFPGLMLCSICWSACHYHYCIPQGLQSTVVTTYLISLLFCVCFAVCAWRSCVRFGWQPKQQLRLPCLVSTEAPIKSSVLFLFLFLLFGWGQRRGGRREGRCRCWYFLAFVCSFLICTGKTLEFSKGECPFPWEFLLGCWSGKALYIYIYMKYIFSFFSWFYIYILMLNLHLSLIFCLEFFFF